MNQDTFNYQLLARLAQDCEYFLGFGNRNNKHLWALTPKEQIKKMRKTFAALPVEPEWISLKEIKDFALQMTGEKALHYSYPQNAVSLSHGFGKTGCWYVTLTEKGEKNQGATVVFASESKAEAVAHFAALPNVISPESLPAE